VGGGADLPLEIRLARENDIAEIAALHEASIRRVCSPSYSAVQIDEWVHHQNEERYRQSLRERVFLVAVDRGHLVGFGAVNPSAGLLNMLYVAPEATGRGVGTELLRALEDAARANGVTSLRLESTLNGAGFYESRGWRRGERVTHTFPSGVVVASIEFTREL
jgi:putative acetyltransferase